jgi:hypothetical protein
MFSFGVVVVVVDLGLPFVLGVVIWKCQDREDLEY